jgi:hypothetical protein
MGIKKCLPAYEECNFIDINEIMIFFHENFTQKKTKYFNYFGDMNITRDIQTYTISCDFKRTCQKYRTFSGKKRTNLII